MKRFSKGDVVKVRTGSDKMIVKEYATDNMAFFNRNKKLFPNDHRPPPPQMVVCEWSNGEKIDKFDEDSLEFA
jgi:uncharacterized protein YodC (DUF2158 family)